MNERPMGISILSILYMITGLTNLVSGNFLQALVDGAIGYGLWNGRKWAWYLGLLDSITGFIILILPPWEALPLEMIGVILSYIILYYLFTPDVRSYFGIGRRAER